MEILIIIVFVVGYLLITLEHNVHINKAATSIITGVLCWTLYSLSGVETHHITEHLGHHFSDIAGILFFLMGAMTIVELIDAHQGFEVITQQIRTRDKRRLLWVIGILTFFLSSVLDNLTTTIVIVVLLKKLIASPKDRLYYVATAIIAANAGGAWSPIGDVTTTMLWIGGQLTAGNIITKLFLPSLAALIVPLFLISWKLNGSHKEVDNTQDGQEKEVHPGEKKLVLILGIGLLLIVPVYKVITHLPPYMGMMLGLGILWLTTEIIHHKKPHEHKKTLSVLHALQRMDMPSILFFFGILLAVSALETQGTLPGLARWLDTSVGNMDVVVIITGIFSAIVDNVPLVAAAMGMYSLGDIPADSRFWEMLAFCAGTGGSMLIIGSAAGVAAMGLEKITFGWYVKNVTGIAILSYFAGIGVYYLQNVLF